MCKPLTQVAVFAPLILQLLLPVVLRSGHWITVESPTHSRAMLVEEDSIDGKNDAALFLSVFERSAMEHGSDDTDSIRVAAVSLTVDRSKPARPRRRRVGDLASRAPPLRPPELPRVRAS